MVERTSAAPMTPQPQRRTCIRRDFAKLFLLLLGGTLFAIVFVRYLSHSHLTAAERRAEEQLKAAAKEPAALPEALAKRLADERALAEARKRLASAPAGGTPLTDPGIPKGRPGDEPLPSGYKVPGADGERMSAQERLALERQAEQLDNQSLVAYEDTAGDKAESGRAMRNAGSPTDVSTRLATSDPSAQDGLSGNAANTPWAHIAQLASPNANASDRERNARWLAHTSGDSQDGPLTLIPAASPYMVMEGTPITTVMLGGTNSDLPGTFRALVDHDIVDSVSGQCVLIPKGTKIIGLTHDDVAIGQERLLLAGTRMIWPNGASLSLTRMPGADPNGDAGLTADVNNHFFKIFGSTLLIGGVAAWIGHNQSQPTGTTININGGGANDLSAAAAQSLSQTTQTILQRNMNIQPTLTTQPGQRMVIVTTRDMEIPPEQVRASCSTP
ncbi:conjugal transfer protein TrbI [Trinickia symbiotica]|uniref:Conjugal transfer protein TrbI n=1 Tax=Trinickia symbiotica TaxID=863227 RepID=A0A2T3XMP4_9BURK|nr:TrbI/VirB10 family protein [Trinickia symbiotica]PTB17779.1 conjugal transfer protein TrbI [Trinickia symbiotica]